MPTVAAGGDNSLNLDIFLLQICQGSDETKGGARKDKHPSDDEEDEEGEQGVETIPKQGKASSVAEALADTSMQPELEAQSAIPAAGKESGKESADSAKPQSDSVLNAVIKRRSEDSQRLKEENEEEVGRVGGETQIFASTQIDNFEMSFQIM